MSRAADMERQTDAQHEYAQYLSQHKGCFIARTVCPPKFAVFNCTGGEKRQWIDVSLCPIGKWELTINKRVSVYVVKTRRCFGSFVRTSKLRRTVCRWGTGQESLTRGLRSLLKGASKARYTHRFELLIQTAVLTLNEKIKYDSLYEMIEFDMIYDFRFDRSDRFLSVKTKRKRSQDEARKPCSARV